MATRTQEECAVPENDFGSRFNSVKKLSNGLTVNLGDVKDKIKSVSNLTDDYEKFCIEMSKMLAYKALVHPDWSMLAGRLYIDGIRSVVAKTFSAATIVQKPLLGEEYYSFVMTNQAALNQMIVDERDYTFDMLAAGTLFKSYLLRQRKDNLIRVIETPQYMYLRVATFLWFKAAKSIEERLAIIKETYDELSMKLYTQASPTLFNSGAKRPSLASCFLMSVDDTTESIGKSWVDCAVISKNCGGIGIDYSDLRHSEVGEQGYSKGIIQWMKVKNEIMRGFDQGGKRKGSCNVYLCDWHVDIIEFLESRLEEDPEEMRARDLFNTVYVSDLFMRRVKNDEMWSLFCPSKCRGLVTKWGAEFEDTYRQFEERKEFSRQIRARELFFQIMTLQKSIGSPFIVYKDACNSKSNHQHLGTIRSSNLCLEIVEYTDTDTIATCFLASVCLPACVTGETVKKFDFGKLETVTRKLVRNLNNVIDNTYYPENIPQIKNGASKQRAIGIGYQGLADTFALLEMPWETPEAMRLNVEISETMYYAALCESVELSVQHGPCEAFSGSPASKGVFQFDLWDKEKIGRFPTGKGVSVSDLHGRQPSPSRYDWEALRNRMVKHGLRNSLLIALMPTASTAHVTGCCEAFEPCMENIRADKVLSGQYVVTNKHMVRDLEEVGLWTTETLRQIVNDRGSMQGVTAPDATSAETKERLEHLKRKYKTAFEIKQKCLLQMSADRGRFVCQSQSLNCFMSTPTNNVLYAYHMTGWEMGLKTGMYYLRQSPPTDPINFSLDQLTVKPSKKFSCNGDVCMGCT